MRVLIRRWTELGSERSFVDRVVDTPILRIGRGTDQDVELADLRIELAHAQVIPVGHNIHIVAQPGATLRVNGEPADDQKLRSGDLVEIGRYRLQIGAAPAGLDFQIDVEEVFSARAEAELRISRLRTRLADLGFSPRLMAWVLFFGVLLPALALPAWLRFGIAAPPREGVAAAVSDIAWSPGPLSAPHAAFSRDCGRCHQQAFKTVANSACLGCHQDLHRHVDDPRIAAMPTLADGRCTDCHREHHGGATLVDSRSAACEACHAQPARRFPGLPMQAIDGFSATRGHPAFKPLVARFDAAAGQFSWSEASPRDGEPHSDTNLRFSHAHHLAAAGLRTPQGSKVLGCSDCHEPDENGVSFKPVQMERHCASCHRLDFDPADPQRTVPHGQPAQVTGVLRDFYAHAALAGGLDKASAPAFVQLRRRPGETLSPQQARRAMAWADHESSVVIEEVFERRLCSTCHVVRRTGDAAVPFAIAPVAPQRPDLLPHARFSHAAHRGETCASCHAAAASQHSEDVLLPGLKRCGDCHGDRGSGAKVQSTCLTCHGFHAGSQNMAATSPPAAPRATESPR